MKPQIRKFIDLNKKYWADIQGSPKKGYILMPYKDSATNYVLTSRSAKSIEEKTDCVPLPILNSFSFLPNSKKDIYRSFNINHFVYYKNFLFNGKNVASALYQTVKFFSSRPKVNDLLKLEFEQIYIGDLVYDTILRSNMGLYTIKKIKFSYYRNIFTAFLHVKIYNEIFHKYPIKYFLTGLIVFIKGGIPARVADKNGAVVIMEKRNLMKNYQGLDIREGQYRPRKEDVDLLLKHSEKVCADVDKYLAQRFAGDISEMDVIKSYKDKEDYDKEKLVKTLGISRNKPIVFIMAHAFSDGPHHTPKEKLLFRDFYVWLAETVKFVSGIEDVNWIVKAHPLSFKYKEEGAVKKLVKRLGKNKVLIAPDDFSTKNIKDLAHAIVTVQGKAVLEYGCFGIPSVIPSYASYSGFGITIEPKTKKEYFDVLSNISSVSKLNDRQIKMAKVLAAIMFIYSRTNDPLYPATENFAYSHKSEEERWEKLTELIRTYDRSQDEFYQRIKDLLALNIFKKYVK